MRRLARFYFLDIRKGLLFQWKRFLVGAFLVAGITVLNAVYIDYCIGLAPAQDFGSFRVSSGDLLVSLCAGMDFYYPNQSMPFPLPVAWMFLILLFLSLTLDYPLSDLNSVGSSCLVVGSSRVMWWLAKCLWVVTVVFACCLVAVALVSVLTFANGGVLSLSAHAEVLRLFSFNPESLKGAPWDMGMFFAVFFIVLCSFALLQLFLSLLTHPVVGFSRMAVLLFLSAYFDSGYLLGEYLMAARSSVFVGGGFRRAWESHSRHCWVCGPLVSVCCFSIGATFWGRRGNDLSSRGKQNDWWAVGPG